MLFGTLHLQSPYGSRNIHRFHLALSNEQCNGPDTFATFRWLSGSNRAIHAWQARRTLHRGFSLVLNEYHFRNVAEFRNASQFHTSQIPTLKMMFQIYTKFTKGLLNNATLSSYRAVKNTPAWAVKISSPNIKTPFSFVDVTTLALFISSIESIRSFRFLPDFSRFLNT